MIAPDADPAGPNPFLEPSAIEDAAEPFDRIRDEHFLPAFEAGMRLQREELARIGRGDGASPEAVITAYETSGDLLRRVSAVFYALLACDASDARESIAAEIAPRLAAHANDIYLDRDLFRVLHAAWEDRHRLEPGGEPQRLLDQVHDDFLRNGASLDEASRAKLRELDAEAARLRQKFGENLRKATNAYERHVVDEARLEGLPEPVKAAAQAEARRRGHADGWSLTLQGPILVPALNYLKDRALREELWRAHAGRAYGGEFDNREIAVRIARIRDRRARLLGYPTHAHYVLERRMARSPAAVYAMIDRLRVPAAWGAAADRARFAAAARSSGFETFEPWDFSYWREVVRKTELNFDPEALRPWLSIETVLAGIFQLVERVFGIAFRERRGLPVYEDSVRVFEARDATTSEYLGLLYVDLFPRPGKRPGAWVTVFRDQGLRDGVVRRPHIGLVCSFTPPTEGRPTLLGYDELRTLLHEFGHALHAIASRCRFASLAGTNVKWDFVELPSMLMENFAVERISLDLLARHHETGESLPDAVLERLKENARFAAGSTMLRQLLFTALDMAWHEGDPGDVDVAAFEERAVAAYRLFPPVPGANTSVSFGHIFDGGYDAGYYSYKWSEILEADAFERFREAGVLASEVGREFRAKILERGDTAEPGVLYRAFRGRDADPTALLRRDGLLEDPAGSVEGAPGPG